MPVLHTAHLIVRAEAVEVVQGAHPPPRPDQPRARARCQRFDVHQERSDPTLFFLIEVYSDQAALDAHRTSAHYQEFREDIKR